METRAASRLICHWKRLNLPTIAEAGYPGFNTSTWRAFFAPAGTPPEIIDRLALEIGRALQMPDVKERFATLGIETEMGTPQELAAFLRKDWEIWDKIIKKQGIKLD